jgi:hypothetical protein
MITYLGLFFSLLFLQAHDPEPDFMTLVILEGVKRDKGVELPPKINERLIKEFQEFANDEPVPLDKVHYEGLLNTHPDRVKTVIHLKDMDKLAVFYWQYAVFLDKASLDKMKDFSLAWVNTYIPDGNPINDNKFMPVIYAYHYLKPHLSLSEEEIYAEWMTQMAKREIQREKVPLNNWETKRINLVGTIALLTGHAGHYEWALNQFRYYIDNALYSDGTSSDIKQRDALSYHVSAMKPLLQFMVTVDFFEKDKPKNLLSFEGENGGALIKSLDYILPYATGDQVYYQWKNSKVKLDHERAKAGIAKYQPGTPYKAEDAHEAMALAASFDEKYRISACEQLLCYVLR